ncbi:MAG: 3-deoxy-manno-octulosonate cytidylyltransferase [Holosporales bacterium]
MKSLVVIPARLGSTRLPRKPLADIDGKPMVVRVMEAAQSANIGPVIVATDSDEVAQPVKAHGGEVVMTDAALASGSDRVYAAACAYDPLGAYEVIINLQGDLPTLEPHVIAAAIKPLNDPRFAIGTLVRLNDDQEELQRPSVVKAVLGGDEQDALRPALYFTRSLAPSGEGPHHQHMGVYAYHREALKTYVNLAPTTLELREKLEQLRALEAGMRIGAAVVSCTPIEVDTAEDLARAQGFFKTKS